MAKAELASIGQLFKQSAELVRRNLALFIFLNTINILGAAWNIGLNIRDKSRGSNWSQTFLHSFQSSSNGPKISPALVGLLIIIGVILFVMAAILTVKAAHKTVVDFSEIWATFKDKWWKIIAVEILSFGLIAIGFVALIVPGLYLLSRLALSGIVMIDQDVGIIEALNKSWDMTRGYAWIVLTTVFFGFVLGLPGLIPVVGPILSTGLTIAYSVALPLRYFELKQVRA